MAAVLVHSGTDFSVTGTPFTPNDESGPLARTPQQRATNVREWPTRSVREGPLFDIRGSVLSGDYACKCRRINIRIL